MTTATEPLHGGYEITEKHRILISRLEHDWSQDELAERALLSRALISGIENGNMKISAKSRLLLATALQVSPRWLQTGELSTGSGGGETIDIRRNQTARNECSERRIRRPYITPPPGIHLAPLRRAA